MKIKIKEKIESFFTVKRVDLILSKATGQDAQHFASWASTTNINGILYIGLFIQ
jgi:hypothetical protein